MTALPFLTRPFRYLNVCLILHASRSRNLGVGALTAAQVDILRALALELRIELRITVLDWNDSGAECISGPDIDIVTISGKELRSPNGVYRHLADADMVLDIGAGDSFADIYGTKRLKRVLWLKYLTHLAKTPLILAPQTFGPFTNPMSRLLARMSIEWSAVAFSRDEESQMHLKEIGVKKRVGLASDVALRLPASAILSPSDETRVGINVSGLLMSGGYDGKNQFGLGFDYRDFIERLITEFQSHPVAPEVHLIGHVNAPDFPAEDDGFAIAQLKRRFPDVHVAPIFKTPGEAKGYIAGMDFFTGSRMHACIAALSTGVAVVPLAYSRKFAGLFGALGYDRVADCRTLDSGEAIARVLQGFAQRDRLCVEARKSTRRGLDRLGRYETALRHLMQQKARAVQPAATAATGEAKMA